MSIGIVSHDSGGAELLSLFLRELERDLIFNFSIAGPALKIFDKNFDVKHICGLEEMLKFSNMVFTTLSWGSNIEKNAIKLSRELGLKCFTFLDHWNFTKNDLMLDGITYYPTAFILSDEYAYERASIEFPEVSLFLIENLYIKSVISEFNVIDKHRVKSEQNQILFLSEPIENHQNLNLLSKNNFETSSIDSFSELEGFEFFIDKMKNLGIDFDRIVIRPHPSDNISKFDQNYFRLSSKIIMSTNENLLIDIYESRLVVGFHTMAMVVALRVGKEVFSAIPPGCGPCKLPFPDIKMLRDI